MKQSEVSLSSAESEVQALASTDVLAEYVKTLRESLCLPTPVVELRCDNIAAIVLAAGDGSWRTKSAANKVHAVKEKVENEKLKVTYVGTRDQCADSLTKFLRGGQEQIRACGHLSLIDLEKWLPRKMELVAEARGIKLSGFSSSAPGVFRIFVPDRTVGRGSELSGPLSLAWRENVCVTEKQLHVLFP